MGKSHILYGKKTVASAAGLLIVIGLGNLFSGWYRMRSVEQKPRSTSRRERRASIRAAMETFIPSHALLESNRREAEVWSAADADGLRNA
jgi:hypothetical protein